MPTKAPKSPQIDPGYETNRADPKAFAEYTADQRLDHLRTGVRLQASWEESAAYLGVSQRKLREMHAGKAAISDEVCAKFDDDCFPREAQTEEYARRSEMQQAVKYSVEIRGIERTTELLQEYVCSENSIGEQITEKVVDNWCFRQGDPMGIEYAQPIYETCGEWLQIPPHGWIPKADREYLDKFVQRNRANGMDHVQSTERRLLLHGGRALVCKPSDGLAELEDWCKTLEIGFPVDAKSVDEPEMLGAHLSLKQIPPDGLNDAAIDTFVSSFGGWDHVESFYADPRGVRVCIAASLAARRYWSRMFLWLAAGRCVIGRSGPLIGVSRERRSMRDIGDASETLY